MINKVQYYKIADHIISVGGDGAKIMDCIPGFDIFTVSPCKADIRIEISNRPIGRFDGKVFHTTRTDLIDYRFVKQDNGYGAVLSRNGNKEFLFLQHNRNTGTNTISGAPDPALVKFALWTLYALSTSGKNTVPVHASAIVHKNRTVLFLGESGTGKSTHTRLWQENIPDVELLNDDSPILRAESGRCFVYGSPWSGKMPCYRQDRNELVAIVRLSQAPHNRLRHLNIQEAVAALYPSCPPAFSGDAELSESVCSVLSEVLSVTPVYHLECLPNTEAAHIAYERIFNTKNSE